MATAGRQPMDRPRVLGFAIIGTVLTVLVTAGIIGQREDPAAAPAPSGQRARAVESLPTSEVVALQRTPAPVVEPAAGERVCAMAGARVDGDLFLLEPTRGSVMATLRVTADVPAEYYTVLGVLAEPIDGSTATRVGGSAAPFERQLPAGAYRLRWTIGGASGPVIDEHIELAPGESRLVNAVVPELQSWVAHVAHVAGLGPQARAAIAIVDGVYALGGMDDEGTIPFVLPVPPGFETKAEIYCHLLKMSMP